MLDTETAGPNVPLSPLLGVDIGSPRKHDNLAVFPLLAPDLAGFPYVLLTDALAEETLHITEVGSGSVPDYSSTRVVLRIKYRVDRAGYS